LQIARSNIEKDGVTCNMAHRTFLCYIAPIATNNNRKFRLNLNPG
jgi:hypothetical protein